MLNYGAIGAIKDIRNRSMISYEDAKKKYYILMEIEDIPLNTFAVLTRFADCSKDELKNTINEFKIFTRAMIPTNDWKSWSEAWFAYYNMRFADFEKEM